MPRQSGLSCKSIRNVAFSRNTLAEWNCLPFSFQTRRANLRCFQIKLISLRFFHSQEKILQQKNKIYLWKIWRKDCQNFFRVDFDKIIWFWCSARIFKQYNFNDWLHWQLKILNLLALLLFRHKPGFQRAECNQWRRQAKEIRFFRLKMTIPNNLT